MPRAAKSTAKAAAPAKKAVAKAAAKAKDAAKKAPAKKAAAAAKARPPAKKAPARRAGQGGGRRARSSSRPSASSCSRSGRPTPARPSSLQAEAEQLAADREPGDVQFDEESGEGDTLNVERERDLALSAQACGAVDEIDAALAKIDDGTYGICEQCGEPIPKERLKALPVGRAVRAVQEQGLSPPLTPAARSLAG